MTYLFWGLALWLFGLPTLVVIACQIVRLFKRLSASSIRITIEPEHIEETIAAMELQFEGGGA